MAIQNVFNSRDIVGTTGGIILVSGIAFLVTATILHFLNQHFCNQVGNQFSGLRGELPDKVFMDIGKEMEKLKRDPLFFYIGGGVAGGGACVVAVSRFLPSNGIHIFGKKTKGMMILSVFIIALGVSMLFFGLATLGKTLSLARAVDRTKEFLSIENYKLAVGVYKNLLIKSIVPAIGSGFGGIFIGLSGVALAMKFGNDDAGAFLANLAPPPPPPQPEMED